MARPAEGNPSTEQAWPPLIARMADAGEENKEGHGSDMRGLEGDQPLEGNEPKKNTASPRNTGQAILQPEITAVYKPGPSNSRRRGNAPERASANSIRNRGIHIDYLGHTQRVGRAGRSTTPFTEPQGVPPDRQPKAGVRA